MITKLFLEDGIVDIDPIIARLETWVPGALVVYDKHLHCVVVESNHDFRRYITDPHILGYEVEE